jgi:hypothetical protein
LSASESAETSIPSNRSIKSTAQSVSHAWPHSPFA